MFAARPDLSLKPKTHGGGGESSKNCPLHVTHVPWYTHAHVHVKMCNKYKNQQLCGLCLSLFAADIRIILLEGMVGTAKILKNAF